MAVRIVKLEAKTAGELREQMNAWLEKYPTKLFGSYFHTEVNHADGSWTVTGERLAPAVPASFWLTTG